MLPWQEIERAKIPGAEGEISLHRRGTELSIRVGPAELMNSRVHGSEEALARFGCAPIRERPGARVLVGGLGMAFTLAATLSELAADAEVVVAELIPAVIAWNRTHLADLAGRPLKDARVRVHEGDVAGALGAKGGFDAILLDVDNGPTGLTRGSNDRLYAPAGIVAARNALKPGGVLAVWSVGGDDEFGRRLKRAGFLVEQKSVKARDDGGNARRVVWVAQRA